MKERWKPSEVIAPQANQTAGSKHLLSNIRCHHELRGVTVQGVVPIYEAFVLERGLVLLS